MNKLRWTREWAGHHSAVGVNSAFVVDRDAHGWTIYERPVIEVAGLRIGDPAATPRSERVDTLALAKDAAARLDADPTLRLSRAVGEAYEAENARIRAALDS